MALCHNIVYDTVKNTYNASSPDEKALVNAAKQFGYKFSGIDSDENMTIFCDKTQKLLRFQLLHECAFTSSRKRMSVIVKEK